MIEQIEAQYEIGKISQIDRGHFKSKLILTTTSGKFMIHPITASSRIGRIFYEKAFTGYLAQNGFPAQRLVETRGGGIVFNHEEKSYYLTEFVDCSYLPTSRDLLTETQLEEAANTLGKLHHLSKDYSGPRTHRVPFISGKVYSTLNRLRNLLAQRTKKDDFDLLAEEVINIKITYISKHPFEKQDFMSLPKIMNHGDYHAGNLLFDSNQHIIKVLDFEYCTEMPRIWDLAWALTWLCRKNATEAFSGPVDLNKLKVFLSSYNYCNPLRNEERIHLLDICISASFHTAYLLEHYYLKNGNIAGLEQCFNFEEWFWWYVNREILGEIILHE